MSSKAEIKKRRKEKRAAKPRPDSKAYLMQRIMGGILLAVIVGFLGVLALNFFKDSKENASRAERSAKPRAERRADNGAQPKQGNTANTQAAIPAAEPKYTFYNELKKRSDEVQAELKEKIEKADKASIKGEHYRIQIGAFSDKDTADRLRAKMILRDYPVQMIKDGPLYLVQLGPYAEREQAMEVQKRLPREGIKEHILKRYLN